MTTVSNKKDQCHLVAEIIDASCHRPRLVITKVQVASLYAIEHTINDCNGVRLLFEEKRKLSLQI